MNNISILGRITQTPEIKSTESGANYARFCLAVKRPVKSGADPVTDFIDCIAWNKTAGIVAQYCQKGRELAVVGRLQTNNYTDSNGQTRKYYEIVVNNLYLIGSNPNATAAAPEPPAPPMAAAAPAAPAATVPDIFGGNDEDLSNVPLPFEV